MVPVPLPGLTKAKGDDHDPSRVSSDRNRNRVTRLAAPWGEKSDIGSSQFF
jgi:hypothetical protein